MVNKKSIDNLLKKKKYKGEQLGRILLLTLVDQIYNRPPRAPIDQLSQMINNLANGYEGSVYNTYVNIYAEMADAYNAIQASAVQAHLGLTNIKMNLSVMTRAAASQEMKMEKPVTITERQYRRYQTKYKKFIKEAADKYKNEQHTVLDYLLSRLETIFIYFDDEPDEDELKKLNSKYKNIAAILEQYKHENISLKWDAPIRKIYKTHNANDVKIQQFNYQLVLDNIIHSTLYDNKIKDQLDNLKEDTVEDVKTNLDAIYLMAKFSKEMDTNEASKYALNKVGLKFDELEEIENEPEKELPDPITKRDIFDYYIFDMAVFDPDNPKYNRIDAEDVQTLNDFYKAELMDMLKATSKDLIKESPKLESLISINDPEDLDRVLTGKELAKAGDSFYKDMTSVTTLKDEHDYGMWNVFPKKDQKRARQYGFSVFHGAADDYTKAGEYYFTQTQKEEDQLFMAELDIYTSSSDQLDQSYEMIEKYFKEYQAYCKFVDGLAKFADSKEVKDFKPIPEQTNVLNEIDNIQALRNLVLSQLKGALSAADYRKYSKRIKDI